MLAGDPNGFFVAVEFAVARLRPTQARELERQGRPGAKSALHAVKHIAKRALETGRTRLPLCGPGGELESSLGAVNAKDLLPLIFEKEEQLEPAQLARPLGHVSESARVDGVLRGMHEERVPPGAGPRRARHRHRTTDHGGHPRGARW